MSLFSWGKLYGTRGTYCKQYHLPAASHSYVQQAGGMEYSDTVYAYEEIMKIIEKYGIPQDKWDKPAFDQPCYVEAQVRNDEPVLRYKKTWESEVGRI